MAKNIFLKVTIRALRHLTSLLLCISLICPLTSCKKSDVAPAKQRPENQNILRYDVNAPFTSLNPTEVEYSGSTHIFPLLYSCLFVPNTKGELEPDLAIKWTYDAETYTWTIHLKKNALFHNNRPVTSRDVQYSFETNLANLNIATSSLIDRISLLSRAALSIHLTKNDPAFPKKIWDVEIIPQPNGDIIDYYNHPIGSGPFKFSHRRGEKEVILVANEDYYGGTPSLDGVLFNYQPNKEKAWARLLSGATDIAQEISPKNYEMMNQYENKFYFDLYALNFYAILLYNTSDPLFSDPNVRLALSHAIDREYIVEKILDGCGVVAVGPLGVDSPYHNPKAKPILYNPQKGLELLKKAGWSYDQETHCLNKKGNAFEFTISVFEEYQIEKKVARYIKLCLNDIGIKVRLESVPFHELFRRYLGNNQFQAVITEITDMNRRPYLLKEIWSYHLSKKSVGCFEHPQVTRLIRDALDEKDPLKQKELFHKVDALITLLQPGTFLFHKTAIDIMSKRFNLPHPFSLTSIYRLKYASLNRD